MSGMLQYSPVEEREIRLLQVDLTQDVVQYTLLDNILPTASDIHYTALSYTWGSSKDQKAVIISNYSKPVSPNLSKALADIENHYRKQGRTHVLLWIDQICIDQENPKEKAIQVESMSNTYRNADTVLVWLSVPAGSLDQGYNAGTESWIPWATSAISDASHGLDLGLGKLEPQYGEEWKSAWIGVLAIVRNPWWERAWIYQEFMLAKDVFFLVDGHALPWRPLHELLSSCLPILKMYEAEEKFYKSTDDRTILRIRHPKTYHFRCPRCEQVRGGQWMLVFLTNPANWLFMLLCYIFIEMLPQEMAGYAGYATFVQRTLARTDQKNFWKIVSSCNCNPNDYLETHLLRFPPLSKWNQSAYAKRWLLALCRDRGFWIEALHNTFFFSFLMPFLHNYVWDWIPGGPSDARPHWVLLNTLLHGMLLKIPTLDFNDAAQDIAFQRSPTYLSWSGIYQSTIPYWTLSLTLFSQRFTGVDNLPLSTVIQRARDTRSTDPRDKIFAFLDALHLKSIVSVDYSSSTKLSAVLTAASEAIITREKRFDQLVLAMEDNASSLDGVHLPSWVPNWSRPRIAENQFGDMRNRGLGKSSKHLWRASADELATVSFLTDGKGRRILRAKAIYVETLGKSQFWIKPNAYKGRDTGIEITTLATLSNPPRTGDEIWLLIGANMPFVLRNCVLEDAIGDFLGSVIGSVLPGAWRVEVGSWLRGGSATSKTYKVVCEAALWEWGRGVNGGSLVEGLKTGRTRVKELDIC